MERATRVQSRRDRRGLVILTLAVALIGSSIAFASPTSAAPTKTIVGSAIDSASPAPIAPSWKVVASPNSGLTSELSGVSCANAKSCLAVGYGCPTAACPYYSVTATVLIERWNGTRWSIGPGPSSGAVLGDLNAVSCKTATFCFAVGATFTSVSSTTLTALWNGARWSVLPSPNQPTGYRNELHGVSCTSTTNCVAVGTYFVSGTGIVPLVEQWNGSSWSIVPAPIPNPGGNVHPNGELSAVSCTSASDCEAVGDYGLQVGSTFPYGTLIERWDGVSWSIVPSPNPSAYSYAPLLGVACASATNCFAVGRNQVGFVPPITVSGFVEHWNGSAWSIVPSPKALGLNGVSCTSGTNCTAGGYGQSGTLTQRWNGKKWTLMPSPRRTGVLGFLNGVSCPPRTTNCLAVGFSPASKTLIERYA